MRKRCYKDLWKITKVERQNWGHALAERHTHCNSDNSRPFGPAGGEGVWIPDFLNVPLSLSFEGEFHAPLGWTPPFPPCPFIHSASRYVKKKKKKTKRPKFAEQRAPSSTKYELWEMKLGRGEMGLAGKIGITGGLARSGFLNQVRPGLSGGELWVTVASCFCCTWDICESGDEPRQVCTSVGG